MYLRKSIVSALMAGAIVLLAPLTALAAEVQHGDSVTVGPNQVTSAPLQAAA